MAGFCRGGAPVSGQSWREALIPGFRYSAYDAAGRIAEGRIEGASEQAAYLTLQGMGLTVVNLETGDDPETLPWYRRDVQIFSAALPLATQAVLAEQMAALFRVQLPATEGLRILAQGAESRDVATRLGRVGQLVAEGMDLPEAFAAAGPRVAPIFLAVLRAGHQSDSLADQLSDLAQQLRRQGSLQGQIATALIYPAIVTLAALVVLVIVSLVLAPTLAALFTAQNRPLPAALAFLHGLGLFLAARWPLLLTLMAACLVGGLWTFRAVGGRLVQRLPLFGRLARGTALVAFLRALAMLLKSGHPLTEALHVLAAFDRAAPFAGLGEAAATRLESGGRASEVLAADARIPASVRELFRIGEETNRLVPVLEALASAEAAVTEQRGQRLLRVMLPALTLLIGLMVGGLVYAIMDAMLSINDLSL